MDEKLFPDRLMAEVRLLEDAPQSFLYQVCHREQDDARARMIQALSQLPESLHGTVIRGMHALDNRRFFQSYAELSVLDMLRRQGWQAQGRLGPNVILERPQGSPVHLLTLSFLTSGRIQEDQEALRRLVSSLDSLKTDLCFAVFVRRWMPHGFNQRRVCRLVERWLQQCEGQERPSRYAHYEDDHLSVELALTGERVSEGKPRVALSVGPFLAGRIIQILEDAILQALDHYYAQQPREGLPLVAAVCDQPWQLSPGYIREFLYGTPRMISCCGDPSKWEVSLGSEHQPSLYKTLPYRDMAGLLLLQRPVYEDLGLTGRAYANPFSSSALQPHEIPLRLLSESRREHREVTLRWSETSSRVFRLGELS